MHGLLEHLYGCLELCRRRGLDARLSARLHRRPRHLAQFRARLHPADRSEDEGDRRRQDRDRQRPLLRDGPRQPLAARGEGLSRDRRSARAEVPHPPRQAITHYYEHPTEPNMSGDEFVTPSVICDDGTTPRATVANGDSVIFYNYRGDRPREMTKAFVLRRLRPASTAARSSTSTSCTMTAYEKGLPVHVAYPKPPKMTNILGEYVSNLGLKQFRCAETEKFPHVTFFFNDYREAALPRRRPADHPLAARTSSTYDQKPEMSAHGVARRSRQAHRFGDQYDLIVVNFANGDMVGHTGVLAGRGEGGRGRRRLRRQGPRRRPAPGRRRDRHRRPRQLRADDRPRHRRPAHRPHDLRCRVHPDGRPTSRRKSCAKGGDWPTSRRPLLEIMGHAIPAERNGRASR